MNQPLHAVRFPEESSAYRTARDRLLRAEMELRRQIEATAALRRALPLGGRVPVDYLFDDEGETPVDTDIERQVRLSDLFEDGKDSLVIYSYMFGPSMAQPCPSCSSILDALDGEIPHLSQRTNVAVVAKSPIQRIRHFARERGWRHLHLLSSAHNTYSTDYHGESADGRQLPALNVFLRRDGHIHHTWSSELMFVSPEPGQDPRHVDAIWPLWSVLDLTPEGRSVDWRPSLDYDRGDAAA
ncbi:DUF899 family protein [Dyella soli]|uniref:DUF899 domain-containing protein n=1 Tax=Dyella soli TaxID=522319 RepID=A0A4R0YFI4_9GAMM|nr:DUF899 family protein [Dyella soli]TCI06903.1 DUF899 domain-containing protein [Dyella soli]